MILGGLAESPSCLQVPQRLPPLLFISLTLLAGDFRQCLPVVPKATRAQIVASTITHAPFWKDVKVMQLKVNMRVLAQAANMTPEERIHATQFAAWQLEVGEGTTNDDGISIKLPPGTSANF
jgi:hypothetical protein